MEVVVSGHQLQESSAARRGWFTRGRLRLGVTSAGISLLLVLAGGTSAYAAGLPTGPVVNGVTGSRPSATRLSFPVSDRTVASVDVGSGNLNVASTLLQLPGVSGRVPIRVAYNSRDTRPGSATGSLKGPGTGWTWALAGAGSLSLAPHGTTVDYTTGDGAVFPFTRSGGVFTSPAGLKAVLVKNGTEYSMTFLASRTQINFDDTGNYG